MDLPTAKPIHQDYAATTPVHPRAVQQMLPFLCEHFGNPASHSHTYGWTTAEAVETASDPVAALNGADPRELTWASGATESNNLATLPVDLMLSLIHISSARRPAAPCAATGRCASGPRPDPSVFPGLARSLLRFGCVLEYIALCPKLDAALSGSSSTPVRPAAMRRFTAPLLALALAVLSCSAARAGEVQVAVAANFAGPLARIAEGFAKVSGHTLKLSSGATGKFYAQVVAGAPFEVLLAADDETPRRLLTEGHGVPGSAFTYAIGRLVLWSARPGFVDDQGAVLAGSGFEHLAIANPKVAPYGQAAVQVLKARGQLERLTPRLVTGETIAQAYQFVATGNAELGFVALSRCV